VNSNSKANKSDDREQAYESCIIPNSMMIAEQFSRQFLPEFGSDTTFTRVWFDASNVRCLQADEDALAKRLVVACGGPYMTPNEARKRAKLAVIEGGDELRTAKTNTDKTTNSEELATDTSNEDEPAPTEQESEETQ
jgi:hypothetical protein